MKYFGIFYSIDLIWEEQQMKSCNNIGESLVGKIWRAFKASDVTTLFGLIVKLRLLQAVEIF